MIQALRDIVKGFRFKLHVLDDFNAGMRILRWITSRRDAKIKISEPYEFGIEIATGAMMRRQQSGKIGQETSVGLLPGVPDPIVLKLRVSGSNPAEGHSPLEHVVERIWSGMAPGLLPGIRLGTRIQNSDTRLWFSPKKDV